jgi:hypothetical protein
LTCKRRGELRGGGEGKGRCLHAICLEADVVDVVDRVNIAAREDVSEKRSLTSLTPTNRGDLTALSRHETGSNGDKPGLEPVPIRLPPWRQIGSVI